MVRQAQVIIRGEINNGLRFAAVLDRRARVGGPEHIRFVKARRPDGPFPAPLRKAGGRGQRFVALPRDEITEADRLVVVQLGLNPFVVSFHINIKASSLSPAGLGINSISGSCGVPMPRGSFWRRE